MYEYKFVYFHEYCKRCRFEKVPEDEEPCTECLEFPVAPYSHKPVHFEEASKDRKPIFK